MTLTLKVKRLTDTAKLRDRRKQNWMEMQQAAIEEYGLMCEVEDEIERRLGL